MAARVRAAGAGQRRRRLDEKGTAIGQPRAQIERRMPVVGAQCHANFEGTAVQSAPDRCQGGVIEVLRQRFAFGQRFEHEAVAWPFQAR